jgi:hypothetical protein
MEISNWKIEKSNFKIRYKNKEFLYKIITTTNKMSNFNKFLSISIKY